MRVKASEMMQSGGMNKEIRAKAKMRIWGPLHWGGVRIRSRHQERGQRRKSHKLGGAQESLVP